METLSCCKANQETEHERKKLKRVTRKQAASLREVSNESAILAPYLMRFYLATANAKSEALSPEIYKHLIGQIVWPANALRRVTPCFPKKDGEDYDEPPHWLSRDIEGQRFTEYPTPVHPVDRFLSEKDYPFHTALQMLYIKRQDWLRNVLHVSLCVCLQAQDAMNQTKIDRPRLRASFRPAGALATSALYLMVRGNPSTHQLHQRALTRSFFEPPQLHPKLIAALDHEKFDAARLTDLLFNRGQSSTLNDEDFSHLLAESEPLFRLLRTSTRQQEKGINVLIYGPPGTGKTEFARWLADTANLRSFEVPSIDPDAESGSTDPINDRLGLVRSSQRLMRGSVDALLLFDEAEDAFPVALSLFGFSFSSDKKSGRTGSRKAWINQLLEETPVPILWISNAIDHMDPAFLRRFTYHLEMRRPSQRVRLRIAQRQAQTLGLASAESSFEYRHWFWTGSEFFAALKCTREAEFFDTD